MLDPRTTDPARAARARVLGEVLATPLMASLARKAYSDTGRDPAELLDPSRFPGPAAIEAHLLDQFVPATYDASLAAAGPGRQWDAEDAHRWLTLLARHARTLGTPEVTWWSLPRALPWPVRHAAVIAAMAMGLVALTPTGYNRPVEGPLGIGSPPLLAVAALFGIIPVIDDAVDTPQPRALTTRGRIPLLLRRTADISGEHDGRRRLMLGLGQEAVWWRWDGGGQVLVRQDNIVLNMDMHGPAADTRLPAFAEEVLHRALTKARRSN
ncbi:hypothetical protein SANT12839_006020 [Streptomyces antimycoticus]|uniref:Uncharacterized protein n=1 Tax=Streptomyces antimycoticus TaxID=68175 RepID=A0A4D4JY10_9ACTN|nr:hypothetical protein [Streptomyces antimycoticus]GDY39720.1 hypothetical protein SANT12839_006020 [Streptomyces antimycoticus]